MQKLGTIKNVKLVCIFGALFIVSVAPELLNNNHKDNDLRNKKYQIVHITDLSSLLSKKSSSIDDKNYVITYQQQTSNDNDGKIAETRLLEIESKGFNETVNKPVYLYLTRFKDSCQKIAYFPEWKINNGTSNGVFRLKINFNEKLKRSDFYYFCVYEEGATDEKIHLGEESLLNNLRYVSCILSK